MKERLSVEDIREMLLCVCRAIVENEAYLTQIDNRSGDGDHGIGMRRGFSHLEALLREKRYSTINALFYQSGLTLLKTMGGASGVLFGTLFTGGLKEMPEVESVDIAQFAGLMDRALCAIMRRGRTKPGEKTMVDALLPASRALLDSANRGSDFRAALEAAAAAAGKGCEATAAMVARKGRARQYGEKSVGCRDAGAASISLIFSAMSRWANARAGCRGTQDTLKADGGEKL
ncbi:MAG TPA: dihydroxyacetone kinase subunit L [Candidatus Pullichristensenella avicola]|nr:dihydroxyacetone kinase subunit L [Candidatus Pullichristensenella avicola]